MDNATRIENQEIYYWFVLKKTCFYLIQGQPMAFLRHIWHPENVLYSKSELSFISLRIPCMVIRADCTKTGFSRVQ